MENTTLILGTAGHIDHGKSSLIRALTGTDPDRLPEEKARGITIELGFAQLNLSLFTFGIVDVPGHERFVRNMLAGATAMDIAMLVVAADDSVKQQTKEHLDILRLLRAEKGVIVLTKVDLVDETWLELVEEEIRNLVRGTFLESAPIVRTSVVTNRGLDELKATLVEVASTLNKKSVDSTSPFRMSIDRVFSVRGHGTVVTGSVVSGIAKIGDELELVPGKRKVRVRSLQNHDQPVESVRRGQRAAINLASIHHDEVHRGEVLAAIDSVVESNLVTAKIEVLESFPRRLKDRARLRLHVGTAEVLCTVRLLQTNELEPGSSSWAQLFLNEPTGVSWGEPFVLREESPLVTLGGGKIVDPDAERIRSLDQDSEQVLEKLLSPHLIERVESAIRLRGLREWRVEELYRFCGSDDSNLESKNPPRDFAAVIESLRLSGRLVTVALSPTRELTVHCATLDDVGAKICDYLSHLHDKFPLKPAFDKHDLLQGFKYLGEDAVLNLLLSHLKEQGKIRTVGVGMALVGRGPKLSQGEVKLYAQLVELFEKAELAPPTVKECQEFATKNKESVPQLLKIAAAGNELVEIEEGLYLHPKTYAVVRTKLLDRLASGAGVTVSEIKDIWGVSRKYALPFCEHFDQIGVTRRDGDLRFLTT